MRPLLNDTQCAALEALGRAPATEGGHVRVEVVAALHRRGLAHLTYVSGHGKRYDRWTGTITDAGLAVLRSHFDTPNESPAGSAARLDEQKEQLSDALDALRAIVATRGAS